MNKMFRLFVFIVFSTHICCAGKQPLPDDVKALINGRTSQPWHRYQAIPPLRIGQKTALHDSVDVTSTNCQKIIAYFEAKYGIPKHLMLAIARVESRCRPWAVHHNGSCLQFRQAKSALAFLKTASGNIQVGCMQLDIRSHGQRFKTTELMMMPYNNIEFAAKLLKRLYKRHGSWERAVSFYHAASPVAQKAYCKRIAHQLANLRGHSHPKQGDNAWV